MIQLNTSSGMRTVNAIQLNTANGMRTVQTIMLNTANGMRTVYGAGSTSSGVTISPTEADGYGANKGAAPIPTNVLTVSGYTGSPTFTWVVPSGWTVVSPGAASTSFRSPGVAPGNDVSGSGSVAVHNGSNTTTLTFNLYASNQGS